MLHEAEQYKGAWRSQVVGAVQLDPGTARALRVQSLPVEELATGVTVKLVAIDWGRSDRKYSL